MASSARGQSARPLMVDVARLAGVSHQTVSRVLNNHPSVSPQTRAGVLAAIRDLGYRPNAAARSLVTGRTNALGVISFDTTLYGPASMLYGIERAARPDYSVSIASLQAFDRQSLLDAVERLLDQAVEGIIVIAPVMTAVAALGGIAAKVPLVAVGCQAGVALPSVAVDNRAGAGQATRHLLDLGHETVYHVAGPDTWLDAQQRIAGWREELQASGATEPELLRGDWSAQSGYEAGHRLSAMPDVTAVFCGNDSMALGVLRALAERGRRVPDEISVVGFDDIAEAPYFLPPLTTVRQNFGQLGRRAVHLLIDQIADGPSADAPPPISPDLVLRASTAPSRARIRPRAAASPVVHHDI